MRKDWNHITGVMVLLVVLVAAGWAAPVQACPSCKVAIQSPDEAGGVAAGSGSAGSVARGFYWSILAMLAILTLVSGGLIRLMIRASREVPAMPPDAEPIWEPSSPRR